MTTTGRLASPLALVLLLGASAGSAQTPHEVLFTDEEKVYVLLDAAAFIRASVDEDKEQLLLQAMRDICSSEPCEALFWVSEELAPKRPGKLSSKQERAMIARYRIETGEIQRLYHRELPAGPVGPIAATADGPFGFSMGHTLSQLQEASNSTPKPVDSEPNLYLLTTAPKPHSAFDAYAVLVGPKSGLCQIRAIGKDIRTSSHGIQVKNGFSELKSQLDQVYGTSELTDRLYPGSIWDEPDDWMMGLIKQERVLFAEWSAGTGAQLKDQVHSIFLAARPKSRDTGFLLLQYDLANASDCKDEIEAGERDAL